MVSIKQDRLLDTCSLYVHYISMDGQISSPGAALARGAARALVQLGFDPICEFGVARGLRVDVIALGPKAEVWIVECKSSLVDFRSDMKWQGYLPWCDRFFWAVDTDFPCEALPEEHGLFLADRYGAEIIRQGAETSLTPARRKSVTLAMARAALRRLHRYTDPNAST